MKKFFLFFFLLYLLNKIKKRLRKPSKPLEADLILAPGGYKGFYMIGICHYIKNHFILTDKTLVGFSCGSFNSLFMRLNPIHDHKLLRLVFALNPNKSMSQMLTDLMDILTDHFKTEDFNFQHTKVGVSTTSGLVCYEDFVNLKDAIDCCKSSSFVPFITYNDLFVVYKNRLSFDGGIFYKKVKREKKKETLMISSSMFGRYSESLISGFIKPNLSYYQLYLSGYRDAQKNHTTLSNYLASLNSGS